MSNLRAEIVNLVPFQTITMHVNVDAVPRKEIFDVVRRDEVLAVVDKHAISAPETGWVVERLYSNETYFLSLRSHSGFKGAKLGDHWYSKDLNDAVRFARQSDAIATLYHLCGANGRVAEHVWLKDEVQKA